MSNKKLLVIIALIVGAMLGLALIRGTGSSPSGSQTTALDNMVGKAAPDFSLQDQAYREFKLSSMRGKTVVLFFNEGIMCYPACWNQIAALGSDKRLNTDSIVSASIVADQPATWVEAFKKMPELNRGRILFDGDTSVSRTYGMLSLASSMHRGSKPGHTYVVVDAEGIVRYASDDPAMSIRNDELASQIGKL